MKKYIVSIAMMVALCSSLVNTAYFTEVSDFYYNPSDDYIVNQIHRVSSLDQDDVDQFKMVWLGRLQEPIAAAAGIASSYTTGTMASTLLNSLDLSSADGKKMWWMVAGAAGIGLGAAYKLLYPRMQRGIISKIKVYVTMCERFTVAKRTNINWASLGGAQGNSMWSKRSSIARARGMEDLLAQGQAALELFDQLEETDEVDELRTKVNSIVANLESNLPEIQNKARIELQQRQKNVAENVAGARQAAELGLTKEKASALKVGKISLAFTAAADFAKRTVKLLVDINDNKFKIAGGIVAVALIPQLVSAAWQNRGIVFKAQKLMFE